MSDHPSNSVVPLRYYQGSFIFNNPDVETVDATHQAGMPAMELVPFHMGGATPMNLAVYCQMGFNQASTSFRRHLRNITFNTVTF